MVTTRIDDCPPMVKRLPNTASVWAGGGKTRRGRSFVKTIDVTVSVSAIAKLVIKTAAVLRKCWRGSLYKMKSNNMFITKAREPSTTSAIANGFGGSGSKSEKSKDQLKLELGFEKLK